MNNQYAMRILLDGLNGINYHVVARDSMVSRRVLVKLMAGKEITPEQAEKIGFYIWKKLNAHLLICETDGH